MLKTTALQSRQFDRWLGCAERSNGGRIHLLSGRLCCSLSSIDAGCQKSINSSSPGRLSPQASLTCIHSHRESACRCCSLLRSLFCLRCTFPSIINPTRRPAPPSAARLELHDPTAVKNPVKLHRPATSSSVRTRCQTRKEKSAPCRCARSAAARKPNPFPLNSRSLMVGSQSPLCGPVTSDLVQKAFLPAAGTDKAIQKQPC